MVGTAHRLRRVGAEQRERVLAAQLVAYPFRWCPAHALVPGGNALAGNFGRGAQCGIEHPFAPVNFLAHVQDQ